MSVLLLTFSSSVFEGRVTLPSIIVQCVGLRGNMMYMFKNKITYIKFFIFYFNSQVIPRSFFVRVTVTNSIRAKKLEY